MMSLHYFSFLFSVALCEASTNLQQYYPVWMKRHKHMFTDRREQEKTFIEFAARNENEQAERYLDENLISSSPDFYREKMDESIMNLFEAWALKHTLIKDSRSSMAVSRESSLVDEDVTLMRDHVGWKRKTDLEYHESYDVDDNHADSSHEQVQKKLSITDKDHEDLQNQSRSDQDYEVFHNQHFKENEKRKFFKNGSRYKTGASIRKFDLFSPLKNAQAMIETTMPPSAKTYLLAATAYLRLLPLHTSKYFEEQGKQLIWRALSFHENKNNYNVEELIKKTIESSFDELLEHLHSTREKSAAIEFRGFHADTERHMEKCIESVKAFVPAVKKAVHGWIDEYYKKKMVGSHGDDRKLPLTNTMILENEKKYHIATKDTGTDGDSYFNVFDSPITVTKVNIKNLDEIVKIGKNIFDHQVQTALEEGRTQYYSQMEHEIKKPDFLTFMMYTLYKTQNNMPPPMYMCCDAGSLKDGTDMERLLSARFFREEPLRGTIDLWKELFGHPAWKSALLHINKAAKHLYKKLFKYNVNKMKSSTFDFKYAAAEKHIPDLEFANEKRDERDKYPFYTDANPHFWMLIYPSGNSMKQWGLSEKVTELDHYMHAHHNYGQEVSCVFYATDSETPIGFLDPRGEAGPFWDRLNDRDVKRAVFGHTKKSEKMGKY